MIASIKNGYKFIFSFIFYLKTSFYSKVYSSVEIGKKAIIVCNENPQEICKRKFLSDQIWKNDADERL